VRRFDPALIPDSPDLSFEEPLWKAGLQYVAGIDEAGRGPIAGPVTAAAIILPCRPDLQESLSGVRDSKQMTAPAREFWAEHLKEIALAYGVGFASSEEIDALGIVPATLLAVERALDQLTVEPQHLLFDYLKMTECSTPQTSLIKGDARSLSIAAASVLAKTERDAYMIEMDRLYPGYAFLDHKGYATTAHREALARLGPCRLHRKSLAFGVVPSRR
jgi:ribonuclease HII